MNLQTIKEIRPYLAKELNRLYPESEIDAMAGIIIKTVLGFSKLQILTFPESHVTRKQSDRLKIICRELRTGKPLQYVLEETSFFNCTIKVSSDVLIPRPETEELVDLILKENRGYTGSILDIGTGSGCIAIALAVNLPGAAVTGIDISEGAIAIARENASLNNAAVEFIRKDIFDHNNDIVKKTGIIVSNPPYVRESEKKLMEKNVIGFEPHDALFVPDSDPLVYYRTIMKLADIIHCSGGMIYFEINEALGREMSDLLNVSGYSGIEIIRDLNGRDRIIKGTRNG